MFEVELKRKLRNLKKLERRLRYHFLQRHPQAPLVWNSFFSTRGMSGRLSVRYSFQAVLLADREERKRIFQEYLYTVFVRHVQEEGMGFSLNAVYEPEILSFFGLPPYATFADIKRRFRELAHQYHPDKGGDAEKMIELLDMYERSIPK
jgi:hypothetical protein